MWSVISVLGCRGDLVSGDPFPGVPVDLLDACLEFLLGRQRGPVLGHDYAVLVHLQQLHLFPARLGAQNEADGCLLAGLPFVPVEPFEVEVHLALVTRFELPDLQFDGYQPPQRAAEEQQVEVEVVVVDCHPLLPGDECPAVADLQEERLHFPDDRFLQVPLRPGVVQTQEL